MNDAAPPPSSLDTVRLLIRDFAMAYPRRTAVMVFAMVAAGLLEGISVLAILPLLAMAGREQAGDAAPAPGEGSFAETAVADLLGLVGLNPTLGGLLAVIVLGMLLKAVLLLLATREVGYTVAHVIADLRRRFLDSLLHVRWTFFTAHPVGGFANAISSEAERSGRAYEFFCHALATAIQALIYTIIVLLISWKVALGAVFAGGVMIFALYRLIKIARQVGADQTRQMKTMMTRIADGLRGMKPLKAMGREARLGALLRDDVAALNETERRSVVSRQLLKTLAEPIIVVFLAMGMLVAHQIGGVPLTTQLVMAVLFFRLITRLAHLQNVWQNLMLQESAYRSLRSALDLAGAERETAHHGQTPPARPRLIKAENLGFHYGEKRVLEGVDLTLEQGGITTVIGPSGSGKTTLADTIIGLQTPTEGRILVDGTELTVFDSALWRAGIGYVPQEMFLFNATLISNVTLDDPSISTDQVKAALAAAGAADFVAALPDNVHTQVGEAGARLSGGQRQRIAIARALVRDPALLILDEATTALDPETEMAICATVKGLSGNRIVLAITHQPAWREIADQVVFLQGGRIARKSVSDSWDATAGEPR